MTEYNDKMYRLRDKFSNLIVLIDESITFGEPGNQVEIFGSTFWSYCPVQYYPKPCLFKNGVDGVETLSASDYNKMHLRSVMAFENAVEVATISGRKLIVVTHYPPTFNGTLAPKHAKNGTKDPKNYLYCSSNDHLVENEVVVAWIYGHTGHNGCYGKLVSNQMDIESGKKDAVLTIKTQSPVKRKASREQDFMSMMPLEHIPGPSSIRSSNYSMDIVVSKK